MDSITTKSQDAIRITRYALWITAIVAFGAFIRLYSLDWMAFHHDESIHAYYSYKIFSGDLTAYKYDPTYHGPFLYHTTALLFLLFGDNDFTARLPQVGFGMLMFYFVWRLKPWIGSAGVLATMILIAASPTLTYFSRFARGDTFVACDALAIVVFALEYMRSRKEKHLLWLSFFLALLYCTKENSYMIGFTLGSFIVFYGFYYFLSYPKEGRKRALVVLFDEQASFLKIITLYAVYSFFAFSLVHYVVKHSQLPPNLDEMSKLQALIDILRTTWNSYVSAHPGVVPFWILGAVVITFGLFSLYGWIRRWANPQPETGTFYEQFSRRNVTVLACVLLILTIYTLLFSTLGTNPGGLKAGVIDYLSYWMYQQEKPRIAGPASYFIPRLLVYEFGAVLFAILAFVVYTLNGLGRVNFLAFQVAFWASVRFYWLVVLSKEPLIHNLLVWLIFICIALALLLLKRILGIFSFVPKELQEEKSAESSPEPAIKPDGLRIFFLYWSVQSLLIYALLQEKVPWLLVHQALPLALLAGTFIGDVWAKLTSRSLRINFGIVVGIFCAYEMRSDILLNCYNNDNPHETMVYTQTDHSIKMILDEIKQAAERLGPEYMPPHPTKVIAVFQDESTWPYFWYLRHYNIYPLKEGLPGDGIPFALMRKDYEDRMKVWAKGRYAKRPVNHRVWWPGYGQDEFPFEYFRQQHRPQSEAWNALWKYVLYRDVWEPGGSLQMLLYFKSPLIEPEEKPKVAAGYERGPLPLRELASVGRFGSAQGEFIEPRGVALNRDATLLYVLDAKNGRIQAFDTNLQFKGYFGGPGNGNGEFKTDAYDGPNGGIGVGPDGTIYATDTWADGGGKINRYKADGQPLPAIRQALEHFYFPRGLAIAANGALFVADTGNFQIARFNPDGAFSGIIAKGEVQEPVGITVGPDGLVYICDVGGRRVVSYTAQGSFVRQWPILGWSATMETITAVQPYIAVDKQGNVYVTDSTSHTIHRFDPSGQRVSQGGGFGPGNGLLNTPRGIAVDSEGNLYIADSRNNRVVKAKMSD